MELFIQFILIPIIFIPMMFIAYWWTSKDRDFLAYLPFKCFKCLSFWSLLFAYTSIGFSFELYVTLIGGYIMTVLNTVAIIIHEKNNTVTIEDYDKL